MAQMDSGKSHALHQTAGSVREARAKYQSAAQARQTLRQKVNSGLVAILAGESESDSSKLSEVSQLFTALEREDFFASISV